MGMQLLETFIGISILLTTLVSAIITLQHNNQAITRQAQFNQAIIQAQNQALTTNFQTVGQTLTIKTITVDPTHSLEMIQ